MPAELEQQLRALQPRCSATRVRSIQTLFGHTTVEEPCGQAAVHLMRLACTSDHPPFASQLACTEHGDALNAMQTRGITTWTCECGGNVTVELQAL